MSVNLLYLDCISDIIFYNLYQVTGWMEAVKKAEE